jgi:PAS domain S-box-containing protein
LQESRHFIEQVACSTPDILYVLSLEKLKTAFINQRGIDLLGFDHDLLETVHPEDFTRRMTHLAACKQLMDEDVKEIDIRMRVKDGSWHWFRIRDIAFKRHADSSVAQIIGIAHDIHEEKLAEEALIQSVQFTEQITNATPDILYVLDLEEKKIVFTNDSATGHLGLSKKHIYDNGPDIFREVIHPDDYDRRMAHIESCATLRENEVKVIDVRLKSASGEWRWFRTRDSAFRRNDDISEIETIKRLPV